MSLLRELMILEKNTGNKTALSQEEGGRQEEPLSTGQFVPPSISWTL